MKLRLFCIGAICAAVASSACTDPLHVTAQSPVFADTVTVYALTGTAPSLPSALDLFTLQPVRVDGFGAFDVAFDIVSPTQVSIIPVRLVVSSPSGVRAVGLRTHPGTWGALLNAPSGGYQIDSAIVVSPGDLAVFQTTRAFDGEYCRFAISPYLYAKMSVLSIDPIARTIQLEIALDPNCGFRSFQPGIPTS